MNFYLGQIGIYGFNFAPKGWAFCNGQLLPLAQNTALFSLLGTTYGGNGQTNFALPDLRSRTPIGFGQNYSIGEMAGVENVSLTNPEMPLHTHPFMTSSVLGDETVILTNSVFAQGSTGAPPGTATNSYAPAPGNTMLNPMSVSLDGGNQPHNNIQPSLAVNVCIATTGYYPARN